MAEISTPKQQKIASNNKSSPPKKWIKWDFSFISKYKKIMIPLVMLIVLGLLYLYTNNLNTSHSTKSSSELSYTTAVAYQKDLESRLKNILGSIKGAGKVEVMVTIDGSPELKFATNVEEKTTTTTSSGGSENKTVSVVTNPIILNVKGEEQPLVLMEILPKVRGVVVVAKGASDTKVKLQMLQAVQALLDVTSDKIDIIEGI